MKKTTKKWIELGDIIEIIATEKLEWHENKYFVCYIDNRILELIDLKTNTSVLFHLLNGKIFKEKGIQKVRILSRSSIKGYARQNGLMPNIWVDIFFGGDVPKSITAEITNLDKDMIELTTYPENKLLYIDFAYQGVPRNLPIDYICIRNKPESFHRNRGEEDEEEEEGEGEERKEGREERKEGREEPDQTYVDVLRKFSKYEEIEEDEQLQEVIQQIEIPPEQQKYGINAQVNDLLDAFLSTIPDYKRTPNVMNKIYTHIQRFKELREQFSVFDNKYHQIIGPKKVDTQPIIKTLSNINKNLLWCIPVVSQCKKVYGDFEEAFDIVVKDEEKDANDEITNENRTFYKNNIPDENTIKYANMYIQTNEYMCPFDISPINKELSLHIINNIESDIDVIVSSGYNDEMYSSVIGKTPVTINGVSTEITGAIRTKFVMERYNSEIQYPYKKNIGSKDPSMFATLFPSDSIAFRSIFTLPEPFIAFSKIKLPNTNILQKTLLHHNYLYYFKYLNNKTPNRLIKKHEIELELENQHNISFFNFQHFVLSSDIDDTTPSLDKLEMFLKKSLPTLTYLVQNYLKKQNRKTIYTFSEAIDILEPFCIYFENATWEITKSIKDLLYENIKKYKTKLTTKTNIYESFLLEKYKLEVKELKNKLIFLLEENKEKQKKCIDKYSSISASASARTITSTSEWLQNIFTIDQAKLFVVYLRMMVSTLYTDEDLLGEIGDNGETNKTKSNKACWKRVITKKYYSVSDLTTDNNKEIMVDKELDTTEYTLLEKYKKEEPELYKNEPNGSFLEFLAENLISKHHYERDDAFTTAKNMIAGERSVQEGEYAILENIPKLLPSIEEDTLSAEEKNEIQLEMETKKRVMYYIRKKNVWIHVPELDELSFIDNNTLICNIEENCYSSSKKKKCEDATTTLNKFREEDLDKMRIEFKNRYNISIENKKEEIQNELNKYETWIIQHKKILQNELVYLDIQCYNKGTKAILSDQGQLSPYIELRDSILAKSIDFITKQQYILLFVDTYCREPLIDDPMSENIHWLYCKETNTPLMPKSLFLLAKAYKENNYTVVLDRLCNTIGKLSDDGDAYVDKYSGYILKKRDFNEEGIEINNAEEEGGIWEDSEKNSSKSFQNIIQKRNRKKIEKIYLNDIDQTLYNIISAICTNIYLENEDLKSEMMVLCQGWLNIKELFPTKEKYQKSYNAIIERQKTSTQKIVTPDDFDTHNKKKYILISAIAILITIQTSDVSIKKSFSRCVKSFYGYPLKEGKEDVSSIKYLACVLRDMYSHSKEDKKLVPKKEPILEDNIKDILEKHILKIPYISQLYDNKRKDILIHSIIHSNQDSIEEKEIVRNKWPHFLPPLQPFTIPAKEMTSISPSSSMTQEILNIYVVKTRILSLLLIEELVNIIAKKEVLFQTKSGLPYLQNACCDEILQNPPISVLNYFKQQDKKGVIQKTVEIIWKNAENIELKKREKKAYILLQNKENNNADSLDDEIRIDGNKKDANKKRQNIFMTFEPSIYYDIAIYYCKLESEIYPIPEYFQSIFSKKPMEFTNDYYDKHMPMVEKMDFLSRHQTKMDATKAIQIMNIVNKRNIVDINNNNDISVAIKIQEGLQLFQDVNYDLIKNKKIFKDMIKWINSDYKDDEMPNSVINDIIGFINTNHSTQYGTNVIKERFACLYNWEKYKNIPNTNILQKMKSVFSLFGIIYPSYLSSSSKSITIPKHWELTDTDEKYLKKELHNYKEILLPYQQKKTLLPIFEKMVERIQPLLVIIEYASFFQGIQEEKMEEMENKRRIYDLCILCLEFIFVLYIELMNDPEINKKIAEIIRIEKQNQNEENALDDAGRQEDDDELENIDINIQLIGEDTKTIKREIAEYLLDMVSTIRTKDQVNAKEAFMMTYTDIITKIDFYRDREKQKIKDYLKRMTDEEQKAEIELKRLRLGVFAIDNKNLNAYGKETGFYAEVFSKEKERENQQQELYEVTEEEMNQAQDNLGDLVDEDNDNMNYNDDDDFEDINEYTNENLNDA